MTYFEFGLVPVAIVVGVAFTRLLNCWVRVIQRWSEHENPGLFLSVTGIILLGMLGHFAADWALRDAAWSYGRLLIVVLPTLALVLGASLMVPDEGRLPANLDEHYFAKAKMSCGFFAVGILVSTIPDTFDDAINPPAFWMSGLFAMVFVVLAIVRLKAVHVFSHLLLWALLAIQTSGISGFG